MNIQPQESNINFIVYYVNPTHHQPLSPNAANAHYVHIKERHTALKIGYPHPRMLGPSCLYISRSQSQSSHNAEIRPL
jgi:hypothetical protein